MIQSYFHIGENERHFVICCPELDESSDKGFHIRANNLAVT